MSTGLGYYSPTMATQTQDATELELAAYNNEPMSKEDFGIISTTQEGIINTLRIMHDEIGKQTAIILRKIEQLRKTAPEKRIITCYSCGEPGHFSPNCPNRENDPQKKNTTITCFNCGEPGHISPNCPHSTTQVETTKKNNNCFTCGKPGHWMNECPEKENVPPSKIKGKKNLKRNKKKENWEEDMKKEVKVPGKMKRVAGQDVFISDPFLFED